MFLLIPQFTTFLSDLNILDLKVIHKFVAEMTPLIKITLVMRKDMPTPSIFSSIFIPITLINWLLNCNEIWFSHDIIISSKEHNILKVIKAPTSRHNVKIDCIYHKYANEQRGDSESRGWVEFWTCLSLHVRFKGELWVSCEYNNTNVTINLS